jgi:L-2-aminoadipate reductase
MANLHVILHVTTQYFRNPSQKNSEISSSTMDSTALLERWAQRLQNLTVSHLPSDYTRPSPPRLVEAALSRSIDPEVQLALFRLAIQGTGDSQATSSFTILLSAFIVLVQRLTGDEDISIGTSNEGGDPFVLRTRVSPTDSFTALLGKVKQVAFSLLGIRADVI